ncbi:hypothetical protein [Chryseobacterium sp. JUb7]|uniref:hypothetical protein n=1 Tax=Chryseobacterium sp. JUb7 TaxID=2940599 RepID=UPI002166D366|nr:hypothetical protein [Chryseobacterium sp. JUb7]MCS3529751.1 hypothetical protein [Chryseobacterium sp. JUb7]
MSKSFKITGGARIGRANATYPFADLYVDENILKINASLIGNLIFQPQDIISIKAYSSLPLIGQGIKIVHKVSNYNENIIFWTIKDPNIVIDEIQNTGFLEKRNSVEIKNDPKIITWQKQGGFPLKPFLPITFIVIWNLLFLYDFLSLFNEGSKSKPFGFGIAAALGLLFLITLLFLMSEGFRSFILKEGRGLSDIKKAALFIMFLSLVMFTAFLTFALS